jgi:hypothetical protein
MTGLPRESLIKVGTFLRSMGWGICFALDHNGYVYCRDGCNWRTNASDYTDYPEWPSARQAVLDYFEGEARRELDMVRDECPGTAAALKEACEEHMVHALSHYDRLKDERKIRLHEQKMTELEGDLERINKELPKALETFKQSKTSWTNYQKSPPKAKTAKTRADELRQIMAPYRIELEMEEAAEECDRLKTAKTRTTRMLNREKKFNAPS